MIVMLLSFITSCSGEGEVVAVEFDPETTYTMKTTDVHTLISDSGITRYRLIAKEWYVYDKAEEPFWYFPEGAYVEQFDSLYHVEGHARADTVYYWQKKSLWKMINNVQIENLKGEYFETSELYWDQKEEKMYSDKFIRIIREDDTVITGIGFESNQDMSKYRIFQSAGEFPMNESSPSDTARVDSSHVRTAPVPVRPAPVIPAMRTRPSGDPALPDSLSSDSIPLLFDEQPIAKPDTVAG